jgi:uncharacterized protein
MLKSNARHFPEIRSYLDRVPVIETHEHYVGDCQPIDDALGFILGNYYFSDFLSASYGQEQKAAAAKENRLAPAERLEFFRSIYAKSDKTAYARGLQIGLRECWGIGKVDSAEVLADLENKLKSRDQGFYERMMARSGIKAKIADMSVYLRSYVEKEKTDYAGDCRFAFSLPAFHNIHGSADILRINPAHDRTLTSLDDYLACFEAFLRQCIDFGVVCIKDQTAYRRAIDYANPARDQAERVFNEIVSRPRDVFGDSEVKVLDDWLFHHFMRLAARYGLPVQLHTGHMAGIRNDIVKTNAANLTAVLELHQDVRFDLFHGNWPYMDEFLFLGKNYPNVWLDLCWVQAIDPLYSVELMKRAVMTVPQAKLFAFGGDTTQIEFTVGYLSLARDNVACALADLEESGWIDLNEARQIAADWFFNNPNEFFNLGFARFNPEQTRTDGA